MKTINDLTKEEQLSVLIDLCGKIYIARNITLSEKDMLSYLRQIDLLFKDRDNFN